MPLGGFASMFYELLLIRHAPFVCQSICSQRSIASRRDVLTYIRNWVENQPPKRLLSGWAPVWKRSVRFSKPVILTPVYNWLFQLFGEANVKLRKEYPRMSV